MILGIIPGTCVFLTFKCQSQYDNSQNKVSPSVKATHMINFYNDQWQNSMGLRKKMALPAQIVALYCLKFGFNAAIHTIILIPIKDILHFYFVFSYCVRGKN